MQSFDEAEFPYSDDPLLIRHLCLIQLEFAVSAFDEFITYFCPHSLSKS